MMGAATAGHGQFTYSATTGALAWDADGTGSNPAAVLAYLAAGTAFDTSGLLLV